MPRGLARTLAALASAIALASLVAAAPASPVVYVTDSDPQQVPDPNLVAIRKRLERVGAASGAPLDIRVVVTDQSREAVERGLRAVVDERTRLVIAPTFLIARAAIEMDGRPPVVFQVYMDDLLQRIPRLGDPARSNATGTNAWIDIGPKLIETMSALVPRGGTLCALSSPEDIREGSYTQIERRAGEAGLSFVAFAINSRRDFDAWSRDAGARTCTGIVVFFHDALLEAPAEYIAAVHALGKPTVFFGTRFLRAGAALTLEPDVPEVSAASMDLMVAVLQGTPTRLLPIVTPKRVVFGINTTALKQQKWQVPKSLILRANVYEQ